MKKILKNSILTALSLGLFVGCSSGKSANNSSSNSTAAKNNGIKEGSVLVIDQQTIKGNFYNGFGNTSEDAAVKVILHEKASLYLYDEKGEYGPNTGFVDSVSEEVDAEGNKTYTIKVKPDLKFNDGSTLNAKNYVFKQLFDLSPEYASVGANVPSNRSTLGEEAYLNGIELEKFEEFKKETASLNTEDEKDVAKITEIKAKYKAEENYLRGIELVDDLTFKLTVSKDFLPYFYEKSYLQLSPLSIEAVAPGAEIETVEGKGSRITGVDLKEVATKFIESDGFLHKPTVTAGSYSFVSFNNDEVILKANPNYPGNYKGEKPEVETVIMKANSNGKLTADRLLNGDVDVIVQENQADVISKLVGQENISENKYNRLGYGYLGFAYSDGPTADVHVRRAIAHLTDRQALISGFLGAGNGVIVNAEYSAAQWMTIDNEDALAKLNAYDFSIEDANKELDESEYKFQKDGKTPWEQGTGYRYNAKGEELLIKHFGTENNPVTEFIQANITENGEKVGLKFEVTLGDWNALIDQFYYRSKKPLAERYSTFNLASNFVAVYAPEQSYHSSKSGTEQNPLEVKDAKYDELSEKMKKISSDKPEEYSKAWLEFQQNFNEKLPLLPLYSNVYHDFYNSSKIESLPTTSFYTWPWVLESIRVK